MTPTIVTRPLIGRPPSPVIPRFMRFVKVLPNGCWEWQGKITIWGYGRFFYEGVQVQAHRVSHILFKGPIPEGFDVDHQCHNKDLSCKGGVTCPHRRCVCPDHIEATTEGENIRRGRNHHKSLTHCAHGHPYDEKNTWWYTNKKGGRQRYCMECNRIASRRHHKEKMEARRAQS